MEEVQFHKMIDLMLEGVQVLDADWRYVYANDAAVRQSQYNRDQLLGFTMPERYPGVEKTELFKAMQRCMTQRIEEKFENEFEFPDGSKGHFSLRILPVSEGIAILSVDRSEYYQAEEKFLKAYRLYKFISAINQSIVHLTDEQAMLDNACKVAVEIGLFRMAWITRLDDRGFVQQVAFHTTDNIPASPQATARLHISDEQLQNTPTGRTLVLGQVTVSNNVLEDTSMQRWHRDLESAGVRSMVTLPIKKYGVVVGSMGFLSSKLNFFDSQELSLLQEAASDIAFAMQNFDLANQHRKMEDQIKESELRFRSLIEKSTDVKMLTTAAGHHLYASPAATSILGYQWAELQTLTVFDLIHPEDQDDFRSKRQAILQKPGGYFPFLHRRKHQSGKWIWVEGVATNMLHEPAVNAIVSNFVDVSQKKKSEQQREFDRTNTNALINNTTDLMWSVDHRYNLITANEPFQQMLIKSGGLRIQSGESVFQSSQSEEQTNRFKAAYQKAFSGRTFTQLEYGTYPSEYWLEVSYSPIQQDGEVIGAACHSRDVTERKKAENHLQQTLKEVLDYKYALDVSSIVAITDRTGKITYVNDNFCRISRFSRHELIGQDHRVINSKTHPKEFFHTMWSTIARGDVWKGEIRNKAKDGTYYWVDTTIIPFVDQHKKPYQFMAIRHDITSRKQALEELTQNNEVLHATNSELDRFVYSVSHDLRSPLSSVLGLLTFVEMESKESQIIQYASMMRTSIERLDNFIRNILNYSRNNRLEPEYQHVNVSQAITEIITVLQPGIASGAIEIDMQVDEHCPFFTDKQRLSIVLENILANAIKFYDEEKEHRFIRIRGFNDESALHLTIEDNGIGISAEYHEKIFNMFFRLDGKQAGTGLGLYIVQETIKKLAGTITLQSQLGKGTIFSISMKNFSAN